MTRTTAVAAWVALTSLRVCGVRLLVRGVGEEALNLARTKAEHRYLTKRLQEIGLIQHQPTPPAHEASHRPAVSELLLPAPTRVQSAPRTSLPCAARLYTATDFAESHLAGPERGEEQVGRLRSPDAVCYSTAANQARMIAVYVGLISSTGIDKS